MTKPWTPPALEGAGGVFVLDLGDDENVFSLDWLTAVENALDEVAAGAPAALVTTASGKFFSNGLDLAWLGENLDAYDDYLRRVHVLLARVLTLGVPTVAAMPGHAFGMGAALALAHDTRVMRRDRGYFCFPEVDLRLPFSPGMVALIRAVLPPATALEATTTGRRYGGDSALEAGIVDEVADLADLASTALSRVDGMVDKDPASVTAIKEAIRAEVVSALTLTPLEQS